MMKDLQFTFNRHVSNGMAATPTVPMHYRTCPSTGRQPFISYSLGQAAKMKRVLILGSSGSGKSTLARMLGATLELPVIHLDRHFWQPGWIETSEAEWFEIVQQLIQREQWIIDGNYRSTLDIRLQAADTVVFLDLPPWLCALRAIKRRIQYRNSPRPDMAHGCREQLFDPQFPQFIQHILEYPNRALPDVKTRLRPYLNSKDIIWLKTTKDVTDFLKTPLDKRFIAHQFDLVSQNGSYRKQTSAKMEIGRLRD